LSFQWYHTLWFESFSFQYLLISIFHIIIIGAMHHVCLHTQINWVSFFILFLSFVCNFCMHLFCRQLLSLGSVIPLIECQSKKKPRKHVQLNLDLCCHVKAYYLNNRKTSKILNKNFMKAIQIALSPKRSKAMWLWL
jgi:hypothetical protein